MDDLALARSLALQAATEIETISHRAFSHDWKGHADPVTAADEAADAIIRTGLQSSRPNDAILSEESGGAIGTERTWVVDPLDGTSNFLHGLNHSAVSIGLCQDGEPILGVVRDIFRNDEYWAVQGAGAFRNGEPISVSDPDPPATMVATGFPYSKHLEPQLFADIMVAALQHAGTIRRFGAAALDFCWVADGKFDGFYEFGLQPWDVAAGICIVREARGQVIGLDGEPSKITDLAYFADNHSSLIELRPAIAEIADKYSLR